MSIPGNPSPLSPAPLSPAPLSPALVPIPARAGFSVGRMFLAVAVAVLGHGVAVGGAFLAGRLAQPSAGGGFEDLAAVVSVLVLAEIVIALGVLVAVIVFLVKSRFDWAVGLTLGWLAGPIAASLLALAQSNSVN